MARRQHRLALAVFGWHRLRANVAALVDWLRICYREGWLGKPRRNHLGTERKFKDRGKAISAKLATMRVRMGVMGAYGDKAEELGLGKRTPPSRRDRAHPPGSRSPQLNSRTAARDDPWAAAAVVKPAMAASALKQRLDRRNRSSDGRFNAERRPSLRSGN